MKKYLFPLLIVVGGLVSGIVVARSARPLGGPPVLVEPGRAWTYEGEVVITPGPAPSH